MNPNDVHNSTKQQSRDSGNLAQTTFAGGSLENAAETITTTAHRTIASQLEKRVRELHSAGWTIESSLPGENGGVNLRYSRPLVAPTTCSKQLREAGNARQQAFELELAAARTRHIGRDFDDDDDDTHAVPHDDTHAVPHDDRESLLARYARAQHVGALLLCALGLAGSLGCSTRATCYDGDGFSCDGETGDELTEGTGDATDLPDTTLPDMGGDGDGDPIEPGGELRCVELALDQVSCWASWELAWARVMLDCQIAQGMALLLWTEGYDDVVEPWGPVVCYDLLAGDRFCLYSEANVLLLSKMGIGWVPEVSAIVGQYPIVDPPCGLCGAPGQPLCGSGDCVPGSLDCDCVGGVCDASLGCTLANTCIDCQFNAGVQGCQCSVGGNCEGALVCVVSSAGTANICAPSAVVEPCEHLTGLALPGVLAETGCVASCVQGDSCGWLECAPIDAFAEGFCAWPVG